MTAEMFADHDPTPEDPAIYQYKRMGDLRSQDFRRAASWSDFRSYGDPRSTAAPGANEQEPDYPVDIMMLPPRTKSMVVNPRNLLSLEDDDASQTSESHEGWDQWVSKQEGTPGVDPSGGWLQVPGAERARSSGLESGGSSFLGVNWKEGKAVRRPSGGLQPPPAGPFRPTQLQPPPPMPPPPPIPGPLPYQDRGPVITVLALNPEAPGPQSPHQAMMQQRQQPPMPHPQYAPQEMSPLQRRLRFTAGKQQGPHVHFEDQPPPPQLMTENMGSPVHMFSPISSSPHALQHQLQMLRLQHQHQHHHQQQHQPQQQQLQSPVRVSMHQPLLSLHDPHRSPGPLLPPYPPPVYYPGSPPASPGPHYSPKRSPAQHNPRPDQRPARPQKSQFPCPTLMTANWKAFCRDFTPEQAVSEDAPGPAPDINTSPRGLPSFALFPASPERPTDNLLGQAPGSPLTSIHPDARFLEIYLTVDNAVRKSNPVEVVLHGLVEFGPVEVIRTCTNKNVSKWQRRHQRTVLVQVFSAEVAQRIYERGVLESGQCVLRVLGPPQPAFLQVTCHNVCLFAYEVHRLSDADLLQILRKVVSGVQILKANKRVERGLLFDTVEEARKCILSLQKPLLENFNVLLYAYSNGVDEPTS